MSQKNPFGYSIVMVLRKFDNGQKRYLAVRDQSYEGCPADWWTVAMFEDPYECRNYVGPFAPFLLHEDFCACTNQEVSA